MYVVPHISLENQQLEQKRHMCHISTFFLLELLIQRVYGFTVTWNQNSIKCKLFASMDEIIVKIDLMTFQNFVALCFYFKSTVYIDKSFVLIIIKVQWTAGVIDILRKIELPKNHKNMKLHYLKHDLITLLLLLTI